MVFAHFPTENESDITFLTSNNLIFKYNLLIFSIFFASHFIVYVPIMTSLLPLNNSY